MRPDPRSMLCRQPISLTEKVYVCPLCGSEYIAPGHCGRNHPFQCREELLEDEIVSDAAVDLALRAFNGWSADHPIDETTHQDDRWRALRRALGAIVDPEGFADASRWSKRYG